MHKNVWTKNGWTKRTMSFEDKKNFNSLRGRIGVQLEEFYNNNEYSSELDKFAEIQNSVQVESPGAIIDELSGSLRDIYQSPDEWIIYPNRMVKIIDPITQVKEFGEWGTDTNEKYPDPLEEYTSTVRKFLEDSKVLDAGADSSAVTDIMGEVCDGYSVESQNRVMMNMEWLGTLTETFSAEVLERTQQIQENNKESISDDFAQLSYEQEMSAQMSAYLANSLSSQYCGDGYSSPRARFQSVMVDSENLTTTRAKERVQFFYDMFAEAARCSSKDDLYGPVLLVEEEIDGEMTKRHVRNGGFCGKLRGMYQHDKKLNNKWTTKNYTNKEGVFVESELSKHRNRFIDNWRARGKDEESLRSLVWHLFDRESKLEKAVYAETGELLKKTVKWPDSIWMQRRTKAQRDLFLTKAQWQGVYQMIDVVKERISLKYKNTPDRERILNLLREQYTMVGNLYELRAYMNWAQKRNVSPSRGLVSKSRLDFVSLQDEHNWRMACAKKKSNLVHRLQLQSVFSESMVSSCPSGDGELIVMCDHPKCGDNIIEETMIGTFDDGSEIKFVQCECGHKVWLKE